MRILTAPLPEAPPVTDLLEPQRPDGPKSSFGQRVAAFVAAAAAAGGMIYGVFGDYGTDNGKSVEPGELPTPLSQSCRADIALIQAASQILTEADAQVFPDGRNSTVPAAQHFAYFIQQDAELAASLPPVAEVSSVEVAAARAFLAEPGNPDDDRRGTPSRITFDVTPQKIADGYRANTGFPAADAWSAVGWGAMNATNHCPAKAPAQTYRELAAHAHSLAGGLVSATVQGRSVR